jgi:hypothetical protein
MEIERSVLTRIAKQNGGVLKVDDVLEEARNEASPLHAHFEWDNTTAADAHRRAQARALIQRCRITLVETEPVRIRAFVSLPTDRENGGGYRLTSEVLGHEMMREELMHDIRLTISRWSQKLHLLDSTTADLILKIEEQVSAPKKARATRVAA